MTTFDSTKTELGKLLDEIIAGKIQLPDFQRGWVWDDEHIRSLLVSIARSFPIGAVMLLETGGEARFQVRPVEGVSLTADRRAERLILDGQQRLTSLTQVLKLREPVSTRDEKKREIKRHYYFDIEKALAGTDSLEESVLAVGEDRIQRANFGRDIVLDLSTTTKEFDALCFPCNQVFDANPWMYGLIHHRPERVQQFMRFSEEILEPFKHYLVPVIELKKETTKEAVCLVFEKVNTGGVQLSVFELVTATYAADGFNLRRDWFGEGGSKGRRAVLAGKPLLKDTAETDFLQGVSLLHTHERQQADLSAGKTGKEVTGVSAKREHILSMPLDAYRKWADRLTKGFVEADQFLRHLGFHHPNFLPYRAQLIPLAATLTHIGDRWLEPQVQDKLSRWYWCGVFGELYGSASETRIALDLQQLLRWVNDPAAPNPVDGRCGGLPAVAPGDHAEPDLSRLSRSLRPPPATRRRGLFLEGEDGRHRPQREGHRHPPHFPAQVVRGARHPSGRLQLHRQQDRDLVQGEPQDRRQRPVGLSRADPARQGGPARLGGDGRDSPDAQHRPEPPARRRLRRVFSGPQGSLAQPYRAGDGEASRRDERARPRGLPGRGRWWLTDNHGGVQRTPRNPRH